MTKLYNGLPARLKRLAMSLIAKCFWFRAPLMRSLPKILLHDHLDVSLRPRTMLELWAQRSFQAQLPFPSEVIKLWQESETLLQGGCGAADQMRDQAALLYARFLASEAAASLTNYLDLIGEHILPLMQTSKDLQRITAERIEDAIYDGIIAMEIRFAPQLHTRGGLTLSQVMDAVVKAIDQSPIPVNLTVCCLRHENREMARRLRELAVDYQEWVRVIDLAGDEDKFPGVPDWYVEEAVLLREATGAQIDIHLTETRTATMQDYDKVRRHQIMRIGHGINGDWPLYEICPVSNIVTGQAPSYKQHPIDRLYRAGKRVTVNTDGLTFTQIFADRRYDLTLEYCLLAEEHGWTTDDLYQTNLWALDASSFTSEEKLYLQRKLDLGYARY